MVEYPMLPIPHILKAIARYSFIQLSELGHRGENENAQTSKYTSNRRMEVSRWTATQYKKMAQLWKKLEV